MASYDFSWPILTTYGYLSDYYVWYDQLWLVMSFLTVLPSYDQLWQEINIYDSIFEGFSGVDQGYFMGVAIIWKFHGFYTVDTVGYLEIHLDICCLILSNKLLLDIFVGCC